MGKRTRADIVMILDATAANRTMYENKYCEHIIYIDMERHLQTSPTLFCDNTQTPFRNAIFDTIFYDPPFDWGAKPFNHELKHTPITVDYIKHKPFATTYYGWDRYKTVQELLIHLFKAQREFSRIIKPDGLLWVKWGEVKISTHRVISIFANWNLLMQILIADPTHTWGKSKTYWLCLAKKKEKMVQTTLL